jgi:hypothetical protein
MIQVIIEIRIGEVPLNVEDPFIDALKTVPVENPVNMPKAAPMAGMNMPRAILALFRKIPF